MPQFFFGQPRTQKCRIIIGLQCSCGDKLVQGICIMIFPQPNGCEIVMRGGICRDPGKWSFGMRSSPPIRFLNLHRQWPVRGRHPRWWGANTNARRKCSSDSADRPRSPSVLAKLHLGVRKIRIERQGFFKMRERFGLTMRISEGIGQIVFCHSIGGFDLERFFKISDRRAGMVLPGLHSAKRDVRGIIILLFFQGGFETGDRFGIPVFRKQQKPGCCNRPARNGD